MRKASSRVFALLAIGLGGSAPAFAEPPAAAPPSAPAAPSPSPPPSPPPSAGSYGAPPPGPYGAPPPGYAPGVPPPYGYPSPYGYPPPYGYSAPAAPAELPQDSPLRYQRRNAGLMMGGIILTTLGGVGMVSAGVLASTAASCIDCTSQSQDTKAFVALTMLIVGGISVGIGVPLIVHGGKRVPRAPNEPVARRAPAWIGAPGGAGWQWRF